MKTNFRHQYRLAKNNPFQGEEWVLFANPTNPDDDDPTGGPEGEAPTNPASPATPGNPAVPSAPSAPATPQANPEAAQGASKEKGIAPAPERGTLQRHLAEILPGVSYEDEEEMDQQVRWATQTHWAAMLGDYNGYQHQIGVWDERKKKLEDDKYVIEDPNFQKKIKQEAETFLAEAERLNLPIPKTTIKIIENNIAEEDAQLRFNLVRLFDAAIARLVEERNRRLKEVIEFMVEDLQLRLIKLKEKWEEDPPEGYDDCAEAWRDYCLELLDALENKDFDKLMSKEPIFPDGGDEGSIAYKEAKDWWYSVCLLEDSYKDFKKQKPNSIPQLKEQFRGLEEHIKTTLNPEALSAYEERVDDAIKEVDETIALLEKKMKSVKKDEKQLRESELYGLRETRKSLEKKKGIKAQIDEALYSPKPLLTAERTVFKKDLPTGLKGQIEFLEHAPLAGEGHGSAPDERRLLSRTLSESMSKVSGIIDLVKDEKDVYLVQTIANLRKARTTLEFERGPRKDEIIWVNPFETFGHLWESVKTTVKGNVETEAKRGAGYFQKQATKFLESMPNPTGVPGGQVLQSLKELSANGQQEAEHAEHGRVGDIEKGYKGFNTEHLQHIASETNVRWEFKACLNLLAERGRINWYDPWIFKQLNRWQKTVPLPEDPQWHMSHITASDDMMRQAFIYIFRITDDYKDLKNKNNGAWESKVSEFQKGLGQLAAEQTRTKDGQVQGGLKNEADKLLNQFLDDHHHNVHFSSADPIKFEAIIRYAIQEGKMQGEDRMYYINQGLASGFLPFDRGAELTKLNNTYPPVDRYDASTARSGRPNIYDMKEWACHDKVTNIYDVFETLSDNTSANQRANKTISQGANRVDHDDAPMLAGHIDAETMQRILTANGQGGYGLPTTGLTSLVVGHELWMDMYAHRYNQKGKEFNDAQLNRFATMFMRFDGITSRQMYANQTTFWRLDDTVATTQEPRAGGLYSTLFGHEKQRSSNKIVDYIDSVKKYLEMMDFDPKFPLIQKLNRKQLRTPEEIKAFISGFRGDYGDDVTLRIFGHPLPESIDKLYEVVIPKYINYITENHPEKIQEMVNKINADHAKYWDQQDAARRAAEEGGREPEEGELSLRYRLERVKRKQAAVEEEALAHAMGRTSSGHGDEHGGEHEAGGDHAAEAHGAAHHRTVGRSSRRGLLPRREEVQRSTFSTLPRNDERTVNYSTWSRKMKDSGIMKGEKGSMVPIQVRNNNLVLPKGKISLQRLNELIGSSSRLSATKPSATKLRNDYKDQGWSVSIGDLRLDAYRKIKRSTGSTSRDPEIKKTMVKENEDCFIVIDKSGQIRGEIAASYLDHLAQENR